MAAGLSSLVVGGPKITTVEIMPRKPKNTDERKQKLIQVVELLKFSLTVDDEEILKSTIESIIEVLEEEIDK